MSRYASETSVSCEKSRAEIESILKRYGASGFAYMTQGARAMIGFEYNARAIKFMLPLPDPKAHEFWVTPSRRDKRTPEQAQVLWEQACRQSWRALALCIKAKLEAVSAGITTFEHEFLAQFVMPNGQTLGEQLVPHIEKLYSGSNAPKLLGM